MDSSPKYEHSTMYHLHTRISMQTFTTYFLLWNKKESPACSVNNLEVKEQFVPFE